MEKRTRILIVDGGHGTRTHVLSLFSLEGSDHETFMAHTAGAAFLQWALVQPDLVLLDVTITGGEGWETLRRIRQESGVPVIALSALDDPQITIKSLQLGADFCLALPVSLVELHARVRALLRRAEKARFSGSEPQRVAA